MLIEGWIALAGLACLASFFLGCALTWLWVEPLIRKQGEAVREAKRNVARAKSQVALVERLMGIPPSRAPDAAGRSDTLAPGTIVVSPDAAHTSPAPTLRAVE